MRAPCAYIGTNIQRKACALLQVDGEDTEVFKVSKAQPRSSRLKRSTLRSLITLCVT